MLGDQGNEIPAQAGKGVMQCPCDLFIWSMILKPTCCICSLTHYFTYMCINRVALEISTPQSKAIIGLISFKSTDTTNHGSVEKVLHWKSGYHVHNASVKATKSTNFDSNSKTRRLDYAVYVATYTLMTMLTPRPRASRMQHATQVLSARPITA